MLVGRMTQAGEQVLASLPLSAGLVGGAGALAVAGSSLWLARPQLVGGPSVASVPLADVGPGTVRVSRFGGRVLLLRLTGRDVKFSTPATADDVEGFLRILDVVRG